MPPRSGRGKLGPVAKPKKRSGGDGRVSAADVIAFIEAVCFVPEGKHVGEKLKLYGWQKREIERIYDNPVGTRRAIPAACPSLRSASKKQAELAAILGSAITRPSGDYFLAGGEDGSDESGAVPSSDNSGNREITHLYRVGYTLPGA